MVALPAAAASASASFAAPADSTALVADFAAEIAFLAESVRADSPGDPAPNLAAGLDSAPAVAPAAVPAAELAAVPVAPVELVVAVAPAVEPGAEPVEPAVPVGLAELVALPAEPGPGPGPAAEPELAVAVAFVAAESEEVGDSEGVVSDWAEAAVGSEAVRLVERVSALARVDRGALGLVFVASADGRADSKDRAYSA